MSNRRVFLYESNRSLLLYLLLTDNLTGRNIYISFNNSEIFNRLVGLKIKLKGSTNKKYNNWYRSFYKRTRGYQFRKLKKMMKRKEIDIYGLSHILLANYLFIDIPLHLFEDGVATLAPEERVYRPRKGMSWKIDKILDKIYPKSRNYWQNKYEGDFNIVEYFYTLFTYDFLKPSNNKFKCMDLKYIWDNKPEREKKYICDIFNVDIDTINKLPRNVNWLFTQPFSEDGLITEDEKIELYNKILENYNGEPVVIKPHPREVTDYRSIYSKFMVFDGNCPIELLACMGLSPKKCITICSTAVFVFYKHAEIDFYGKEIHPNLIADNQSLDFLFKRNAFIK